MAENERDVVEEEAMLRLTIKTTKRKESVRISGDATVKQVNLNMLCKASSLHRSTACGATLHKM